MEFELAYYDSAIERCNHYTTRTPPGVPVAPGDKLSLAKQVLPGEKTLKPGDKLRMVEPQRVPDKPKPN